MSLPVDHDDRLTAPTKMGTVWFPFVVASARIYFHPALSKVCAAAA